MSPQPERTATVVASILWRRLDVAGHDACRLLAAADGWRLDGTAVFLADDAPARLAYRVDCDAGWRTRRGRVQGWFGARAVDLEIERTAAGAWRLDGVPVPGLEALADLDFGFTPATNLIALRRLALAVGATAEAPAAWLDAAAGTLGRLKQRYARKSETLYNYEAPEAGYAAVLEVTPDGFVCRYRGLWEVVG